MTQDLNTCPVGSVVNISDLPEYQGITVMRVSDSGVTVSGNGLKDFVLSGRSPAQIIRRGAPAAPEVREQEPSAPVVVTDMSAALKPNA